MAGDQDSVCFPGGAAFLSPMPQTLHHCQSATPLCSSLPMSDGGPTHLPPGLGALQHELLSEPPYDLPQNSDEGRDSYCSQWERLGSSVSAPLKGYYPTISSVGSSLLPAGMIGFSPLVEGALQRDSVLGPRCSTVGSSMMPLEAEDFSAFGEVEIPCDSMAVQFNSPLPSSIDAGAASYCPSSYKESLPCSSAAPSTETSAICSNIPTAPQLAAASFHQAPEKHISCYSSSTIPVDESPSISSNEQMVHPQAELSERNDLDISIIWTIEEQQLLNELLRRYGHVESNVARLAKIARPFAGKSIRDVALRIRWMEENRNQSAKIVNSLRSHRAALRAQGRSRDCSSQVSSRSGIPY